MTQLLFLINVILITRLVAFHGDRETPAWRLVACAGAQVVLVGACAPSLSEALPLVAIVLVASGLLYLTEWYAWREIARLVSGLAIFVTICFGYRSPDDSYVKWASDRLYDLFNASPFGADFRRVDWLHAQAYLCGLLLCLDEANFATRSLIRTLGLRPKFESLSAYKKGGAIGSLERVLVFVFVVNNAFNAVAFILTAKGLVRLRSMQTQADAEYVLIGTLTSTLVAILLAVTTVSFLFGTPNATR